ncbi:hypothetical protein ACHAXA_006607 [Cyclostephanos tholiformis]|uniref:DUF1995 domain-containing protein n=1 Tax=Cyclostephanos tholiformis TaxID=382380 RepID=A0ABD3RYR9_9STRA
MVAMKITAIILFCSCATAFAFSPSATASKPSCIDKCERVGVVGTALALCPSASESAEPIVDGGSTRTTTDRGRINDSLRIPSSYGEMIQQVSSCMSDAYDGGGGMTRQIVRILLPRDAASGQLGELYEAEAETDGRSMSREVRLVPTDESWQGGIMQLYRSAEPSARDILSRMSPSAATTGVPPRIIEDRSIDESGVDGIGLLYTQSRGGGGEYGGGASSSPDDGGGGFGGIFGGGSMPLPTLSDTDMCVFVQPTQEVVDVIEKLTTKTNTASSSSPLIALLNPQWRNVDDALDSASKSGGVLGAFASFLGGKGSVLRRLDELGYKPTYTLEGYVCKGGNVRLIKRYDSDWIVFAEKDDGDNYARVGSMRERPTYQDVERMLDEKGVGYKYARDLGMAPKL